MDNRILRVAFHKYWLNHIKKELGGVCTYISHVSEITGDKVKYFLKVNLKNDKGGIDKVKYQLMTPPDNLIDNDYQQLLDILKEKRYEGRNQTV